MERIYTILNIGKLKSVPLQENRFNNYNDFKYCCDQNDIELPDVLADGFNDYNGYYFWVHNPVTRYGFRRVKIRSLKNIYEVEFGGDILFLYIGNRKFFKIYRLVNPVKIERVKIYKDTRFRLSNRKRRKIIEAIKCCK